MALLIVGGNGFVGSAAAKYAVQSGLKVFALSRRGRAPTSADWADSVEWVKGDAMDPTSYAKILPEVTGVLHSVGVLLDSKFCFKNTYKGSYEQMNRDTAIEVAGQMIKGKSKATFVYVSAERGMFFSPRYLSTKQDVEYWLKTNRSTLASSVVKPGFMYDESSSKRAISTAVDLLNQSDKLFDKLNLPNVKELLSPSKSLPVDKVGKVAVLWATKEELKGRELNVEEIEAIANSYQMGQWCASRRGASSDLEGSQRFEQVSINNDEDSVQALYMLWEVLEPSLAVTSKANEMIKAGVNPISPRQPNQDTALHMACRAGLLSVVEHMVAFATQHQQEIGLANSFGNTSLHTLTMTSSREDLETIARWLCADGKVDWQAKNKQEKTALDILDSRLRSGAINILSLRSLHAFLVKFKE